MSRRRRPGFETSEEAWLSLCARFGDKTSGRRAPAPNLSAFMTLALPEAHEPDENGRTRH